MNKNKDVDVIIIARGGGSLEDLWPFNEEEVVRAIYNSQIPIISAVGHETDFSISDFVADLRAPTPSAAAELAVPDVAELKATMHTYKARFKNALIRKIELMKMRYSKCMESTAFKEPTRMINDNYLKIDSLIKTMENVVNKKEYEAKTRFVELTTKLDSLSPLKTLTRGYCLAENDGKIIKSVKEINKDEEIDLKFHDGNKKVKVL